jgi:peptidoglycan/xylan/chitin deacetylase (PgdA/CDA1 family)
MKTIITLLVAVSAFSLFLLLVSLAFGGRRRAARIILFHSIDNNTRDSSAVSLSTLESVILHIKSTGLKFGVLAEAATEYDTVCLTFDDGYDDLMAALPLLKEQKAAAVVFVPTAYIGEENEWENVMMRGKRKHLDKSQIRQLAAAGIKFGSHGHTHRDLTTLPVDELKQELEYSRQLLAAITEQKVEYLAYPFGRYNDKVEQAAQKAGYRNGLAANGVGRGFTLARIPINRLDNRMTISQKLSDGPLNISLLWRDLIVNQFSRLTKLTARPHTKNVHQ